MSSWAEITEMYTIAAQRKGTPYEGFGSNMLDLIHYIKDDAVVSKLIPSMAMWTLLLGSPDNKQQSIHLSWGDGKFVVFLTHNEQEKHEVALENVLDIVRDFAKVLQA